LADAWRVRDWTAGAASAGTWSQHFTPGAVMTEAIESLLVTRIVIERRIGADGEDDVMAAFEDSDGNMPGLVEILGMLELTKDTAVRAAMGDMPEEHDEDDE
jgi:hypothetical protein